MATRLGELVRAWRTVRGMSLGSLALKAGVNKSTLSRWESGVQQPRLPELEAVLDALRIPSAQRPEAFALVEAPRALRRLRRPGEEQNLPDAVVPRAPVVQGVPPTGGDLLRAIRLRHGWTQVQVAALLGVRQSRLARWERSEQWPDPEHLAMLCRTLDAHPAETAALIQGRFSLASAENPSDASSVIPAVINRYGNFLFDWRHGDALMDLTFLSLEAQLWPFAARSDQARALLADIAARHAHLTMEAEHFTQVHHCLSRIPPWRPSERRPPNGWPAGWLPPAQRVEEAYHLAAIVKAQTEATLSKGTGGVMGSARLLEKWIDGAPFEPRCTPWAFSTMADLLMRAGEAEAALRMAQKACHLVEEGGDSVEIAYRRRDLVSLLLRAGRAEEAAARMETVFPVSLRCDIVNAALWAEILLALGECNAAESRLEEASHLLEERNLTHLRPRLEPAQRQLMRL